MTMFYAHSENETGERHPLAKHLLKTAELARSFSCDPSYHDIFNITGLLHDLGKYQVQFQNYLFNGGRRGSVPHASWGAGYARIIKQLEASIAIDGHHKGMPDNADWKTDTDPFKNNDVTEFNAALNEFYKDTCLNEEVLRGLNTPSLKEKTHREIFTRFLFSALTDSDWLSTEAHFELETHSMRSKIELPVDEMIEKLEKTLSGKPKNGDINDLRNAARVEVLSHAEMPCGFYSLALPTGLGKTLTSISWALKHAKKNDLRRIIVVLPYVNIIDQTAKIFKDIFGEKFVLEHHSGYNEPLEKLDDKDECMPADERKKRLACENWDYPLIVTTTVQFFESLFSNKPSKCRKVHNISNSVVIFDEVQTLPKHLILPTLQMLKDVKSVMKTSFLFCTATQPAFEKRHGFEGIDGIVPLIADPARLYEATRRVKYSFLNDFEPVSVEMLFEEVSGCDDSVLVIFNTKKAAAEFFDKVSNCGIWREAYHLSTAMCPDHRKSVIKSIIEDLTTGKKIIVVSTQSIEAGVDLDFPVVFRAAAPLESIIQAAGRCNREGLLGHEGGQVYIFRLADSGMPDKTYSACAGHALEMIKSDPEKIYHYNMFNEYYRQIINLYVDPDKKGIIEAREKFNFETVNNLYKIIENATIGLYIYQYSEESGSFLDSLKYKTHLSRNDFRKMQMFTVQVYREFMKKNGQFCQSDPRGFIVWYGKYDRKMGLAAPNKEDEVLII